MRILSFLALPQDRGNLAGSTQGLFWQAGEFKPWIKLKGLIAKRAILSLECDAKSLVARRNRPHLPIVAALDFRFSGSSAGLVPYHNRPGPVYAEMSLVTVILGSRNNLERRLRMTCRSARLSIVPRFLQQTRIDSAGTPAYLNHATEAFARVRGRSIGLNIPSVIFADEAGMKIAVDGTSGAVYY
jgi:hypothetical protein